MSLIGCSRILCRIRICWILNRGRGDIRAFISIVLKYSTCTIHDQCIIVLGLFGNVKWINILVNNPVKITFYNSHWCWWIRSILRNAIWSIIRRILRNNWRLNRFRSCIILNYCTTVIQYKVIFSDLIRYISLHHLSSNPPFEVRLHNSHWSRWFSWHHCIILRLWLILWSRILLGLHWWFRLRSRIILDNGSRIVKHEIFWSDLSCDITSYHLCAHSPLEICGYSCDWLGLSRRRIVCLCGSIWSWCSSRIGFRLLNRSRLRSSIILNDCARIIKN